jgi:hypothetical protein
LYNENVFATGAKTRGLYLSNNSKKCYKKDFKKDIDLLQKDFISKLHTV